jgi:hypothetical protein
MSSAFYRAVALNNQLNRALRGAFKRVNPAPSTATDSANVKFLHGHAQESDTLIKALHLLPMINTDIQEEFQYERDHQAVNP